MSPGSGSVYEHDSQGTESAKLVLLAEPKFLSFRKRVETNKNTLRVSWTPERCPGQKEYWKEDFHGQQYSWTLPVIWEIWFIISHSQVMFNTAASSLL